MWFEATEYLAFVWEVGLKVRVQGQFLPGGKNGAGYLDIMMRALLSQTRFQKTPAVQRTIMLNQFDSSA